jgi:hypothetical protein
MRSVSVHPEKSIRFTEDAQFWCVMINLYRKIYPMNSFKTIAHHFKMSETNVRRYYYGIHHHNGNGGYTQIRKGACVPIR